MHRSITLSLSLPIISAFLSHGADPNIQDREGATSLHLATEIKNIQAVEKLLQNTGFSPDLSIVDSKGNSALHIACESNQLDIVRMLIQAKANPNLPNLLKRTPLHLAAEKATKVQIIEDLIANGAIIDSPDNKQNTPLHLAVVALNTEIAVRLVAFGASVCLPNSSDITPLDIPSGDAIQETNYLNQRNKMLVALPKEPTWLPDALAPSCQVCKKKQFSSLTRRHHCRHCGRVVCDACSSKKSFIPKFTVVKEAVRVCTQCHPVLTSLLIS